MKIIEVDQGSPEWFAARNGIPSASNFKKIITPATGKLSAQCDGYICELIAERYAPVQRTSDDGFQSRPVINGIMTEPEARRWYEYDCGLTVQQVGFCLTDDGRFGCSPDGLVGEDGGLELKCPELKTHIAYLLDGGLPSEYKAQVHGSMIVTGRKWWQFVSYAHGLPPFSLRVEPDAFTEQLRAALEAFHEKLTAALETIKGRAAA